MDDQCPSIERLITTVGADPNPKLGLCPFIDGPPIDGHVSGAIRKPSMSSQLVRVDAKSVLYPNPKLGLCPFFDGPPIDGHVSGAIRKPSMSSQLVRVDAESVLYPNPKLGLSPFFWKYPL